MSFNSNLSYNIVIAGQNTSDYAFQQASNSLIKLQSDVEATTQSMRKLKQETAGGLVNQQINQEGTWTRNTNAVKNYNTELKSTIGNMGRMVFSAQMSLFYIGMLSSNLNRNKNAVLQLESAQERLTKAQQDHGRNSYEYRQALRAVETAQNNLNATNLQATVLNVAMGLNMMQMGVAAYQALPGIKALTSTLRTYNVTAAITNAVTGVGWVKLIAGLAVGGLAIGGLAYLSSQGSKSESANLNVNTVDSDIINQYLQRTGKTKIDIAG